VKAILRKLLVGLIAAATIAAAAAVLVVSAGFALFALVRESLGAAGAAAVVALAAAVLAALVALMFERWANGSRAKAEVEPDLAQKLFDVVRDRPIVSAGALIGAITLAIRNPALTAIVVKAFLDPKGRPQTKKSRS
jgi:hypothetical protein